METTWLWDTLVKIGRILDPYDIEDAEEVDFYYLLANDEKAALDAFFSDNETEDVETCLIGAGARKELKHYREIVKYYNRKYGVA